MSSQEWEKLNERQRAYLRALYECDQATEADRRAAAARGFYDRRPASEWRWQMYGPVAPPSQLYEQLRLAGLVDAGTGSTWSSLERRGLVRCSYVRDAFGVQLLQVQITPAGRKMVRVGLGQQAPRRPPAGQLRERQWAALARLYVAGDEGQLSEYMMYGEYGTSFKGFDWTQTLLRLREYRPRPLMEEFNRWVKRQDGQHSQEYRMRVTAFGREYYEREWSRYRDLYPGVDAPEPSG